MSFAVLATTDEETIFLGQCAQNRVAFGILCVATCAADPFTGGQKVQPFNIESDVVEAEKVTLKSIKEIAELIGCDITHSEQFEALIATISESDDTVLCSILLQDNRRILAQMNNQEYENLSSHLFSRRNWKAALRLKI